MKFCCTTAGSLFTTVLLNLIVLTADSQVSSLSPYSRFGIGNITLTGSVPQMSMGGVSAPFYDLYAINSQNPATYPFLVNTTFQVGGKGTYVQLSDASNSETLNLGAINDVNFVFKRRGSKTAFGLGLEPFSTTGYSITDQSDVEGIGPVNFSYDGQGGINKAHFGVARKFEMGGAKGLLDKAISPDSTVVKHHVALGVNSNFFFGSINQTRRVRYENNTYLNTRISSSTSIFDLNFEAGAFAKLNLTNKFKSGIVSARSFLLLGAAYRLGGDMSTRFEEITESVQYFSDVEIIIDTVSTVGLTRGTITIPERITAGIGYEYTTKGDRKFRVMADYKSQDWSKFEGQFDQASDSSLLTNSSSLSLGFEYTPRSVAKAVRTFQATNYQVGFRMTDTYLQIQGEQLQEMAASIGISVPLVKSKSASKFNLGMEFGTRGSTDNNLIKEQFANVYIGFSLSPHVFNNWFVERKYD